MQTGVVKRFNKIKGYGFIAVDQSADEIFVHFSEIQTDGYKELKEGQRVRFEVLSGERGLSATAVNIID
jgi:CspA family cold shock protein